MENQAHLKVFRSSLGHPTTIARRPRRRAIDQRSDTIAVIDEAIKALNAANLLTQRKRTRDDRVHAVDYIETAVRKLREYQR